MHPRHRPPGPLPPAAAAAALAIAFLPAPARGGGWSVHVGPMGGIVALDTALRDYRWDTSARPVWGLGGALAKGRIGAGIRVWRARTTQATGIPGETFVPDVDLTGTELTGSWRLARVSGVGLRASASVGALHLGWSPDSAVLRPFGPGETIEVSYDAVTEPMTGLGVSARRTISGGLDLVLGAERSWFRLDTVHRAGDGIVGARSTYGHWTLRAELTHRILSR